MPILGSTRLGAVRGERGAVVAVALVAAAAVRLAFDHRPTGLVVVDDLYVVAAVVGFVLAASAARRWTWVVAAGVALVATGDPVAATGALVALAASGTALLRPWRLRVLGAFVGATTAWGLSGLDSFDVAGAATAIAAVAALPVVVSAYRLLTSRTRRVLSFVGTGVLIASSLAVTVGLLVLPGAARDVRAAAGHARDGVAALREGDTETGISDLRVASRAFERARRRTDGPLADVASMVPLLGQHVRALDDLAASGEELSSAATDAVSDVGADDLRLEEGRIDLVRIDQAAAALSEVVDVVGVARQRTGRTDRTWLVPSASRAFDDLEELLVGVADDVDTASQVVAVLPELLGAHEERDYLVLLTSPAEARDLGGFTGAVAVLTIDDGALSLAGPVDATSLTEELGERGLSPLEGLSVQYRSARPWRFVQNWTATSHLAEVRDATSELWQAVRGGDIDGVIVLDAYALGALVELAGPVVVPDVGTFADAGDTASFLLREQYRLFPDPSVRRDLLGDIGRLGFQALTTDGRFSLPDLIEHFGPLVDQGRVLMSAVDPAAGEMLVDVGLHQPVRAGGGDRLHVSQANNRSNKLDAYLDRDIDYSVRHDPVSGDTAATVELVLENTVEPAAVTAYVLGLSGPDGEPVGTNRATFAVLSPLDLGSALLDGVPVPASTTRDDLAGLERHEVTVDLPPGRVRTLVIQLEGQLPPGAYTGLISVAPGASLDDVSVEVSDFGRKIRYRRGRMPLTTPIGVTTAPSVN